MCSIPERDRRTRNWFRGMLATASAVFLFLTSVSPASAQFTFGDPITINPSSTNIAQFPRVAGDGANEVYVVWFEIEFDGLSQDGDIWFARSTDGGQTWSVPVTLSANAESDTVFEALPAIAADANGNIIVVWQALSATNENDLLYASSTDGGLTWTAPAFVHANAATDAGNDISPAIATDGDGNWSLVWETTDAETATPVPAGVFDPRPKGVPQVLIEARIVEAKTSFVESIGIDWSDPELISSDLDPSSTTEDSAPDIIFDSAGSSLIAFQRKAAADSDIYFSLRPNGSSTWAAPAPVNTDFASDTREDRKPTLTSGEEGWMAVWGVEGTNANTIEQIYSSAGNPDAQTWGAPQLVEDTISGGGFIPLIPTRVGSASETGNTRSMAAYTNNLSHIGQRTTEDLGLNWSLFDSLAETGEPMQPDVLLQTFFQAFVVMVLQERVVMLIGQTDDAPPPPPAAPMIHLYAVRPAPGLYSVFLGLQDPEAGPTVSNTVTIINLGNAPLQIQDLDFSGSFEFQIMDSGETPLAPGETRRLTLRYDPTDSGTDEGVLVITSNDPDFPQVTLEIIGTGTTQPEIELSAEELDFGDTQSTRSVLVDNIGTKNLVLSKVYLFALSDVAGFDLGTIFNGPLTITPDAAPESFVLHFTPGATPGKKAGTLVIESNDDDESEKHVRLSGKVGEVSLEPQDSHVFFGRLPVDLQDLASLELIARLTLVAADVPVPPGAVVQFSIVGPHEADYFLDVPEGAPITDFALPYVIPIRLQPQGMGLRRAQLIIDVIDTTALERMGTTETQILERHTVDLLATIVSGLPNAARPAWRLYE